MSEMVSSLLKVTLRGSGYIVIAVNESDYDITMQNVLARQAATFGRKAGLKARIIHSYREATNATYEEVKAKPWPAEIENRICNERAAFLIFIKRDFDGFDPRADEWCVVWISAFTNSRSAIPHLFDQLDAELQRKRDLFTFLRTKLDGHDRAFPIGCLSSPGRNDVLPARPKKGREGIADAMTWLTTEVLLTLLPAEPKTIAGKHGWQMELSHKVAKRDGRFRPKSICDYLRAKGMFNDVKRAAQAKRVR